MKGRRDFFPPLDIGAGRIELGHGSGGRATAQLIEELFSAAFDNDWLRGMNDQASFEAPPGRLVLTTDSFVVSPLFFPGGDIGCLAVNGTVNDIAMAGAKPLYLSASFILEEGFPLADLHRVVQSMAVAARAAGVAIITGDTKVVERGKADGVFITTTGVGNVPDATRIDASRARPNDRIILSGTLGDHGVAVLSRRENLHFETELRSDSAPLHELVAAMLAVAPDLHCLRDPTRGGLAAVLNEWARQSDVGMIIHERAIPIRPEVAAACEFLGLDPLYLANEGKLVAVCPPQSAEDVVRAMRRHPLGRDATIIGEVRADAHRAVEMETAFGGRRLVDWLSSDPLPRIC